MPCSWTSRPSSSPSREIRSVPVALTAYISRNDTASVDRQMAPLPIACAFKLRPATAIEQPLHDRPSARVAAGCGRRAISAGRKQTERQRPPDAGDDMDGDGANGIIDADVLEQINRPDHDQPRSDTDEKRSSRADPVARAGDRERAPQESRWS